MDHTIFFSWQLDSPKKCNRDFIREALEEATKAILANAQIEDSPRVDSGMEGISGSPEVASIMFEKIDRCALFVADVTLVGTVLSRNANGEEYTKKIPNPNVSLEMGYAAARIGWDRVICVMNETFGGRDEQPFDVRNRRFPIDYHLDPDKMDRQDKVKATLVKVLTTAIDTAENAENRAVDDAIERLDSQCMRLLMECGKGLYFHVPEPKNRGEQLNGIFISGGVGRLLDLKLIRYKYAKVDVGLHWAYHWTYLGKLLLKKMQISDLTALRG